MNGVKKESTSRRKCETLKRMREHIRWGKKVLIIMTICHLIIVVGLTQIQEALERRLTADDCR